MNHELQGSSVEQLLDPSSKANTAAATSAWVDCRNYEGSIAIILNVGTISAGTLTPTIEHADDGSGTNGEAIVPNEGDIGSLGTGADETAIKRTINANSIRGFVRVVGTIVTGPAELGAVLVAKAQHT